MLTNERLYDDNHPGFLRLIGAVGGERPMPHLPRSLPHRCLVMPVARERWAAWKGPREHSKY